MTKNKGRWHNLTAAWASHQDETVLNTSLCKPDRTVLNCLTISCPIVTLRFGQGVRNFVMKYFAIMFCNILFNQHDKTPCWSQYLPQSCAFILNSTIFTWRPNCEMCQFSEHFLIFQLFIFCHIFCVWRSASNTLAVLLRPIVWRCSWYNSVMVRVGVTVLPVWFFCMGSCLPVTVICRYFFCAF